MKTRRLIALLAAAIMVFAAAPAGDLTAYAADGQAETQTQTAARPAKITVTGSKYVAQGKKITLKASVSPADASQKVTWKSSDKSIATVSSKGVVKGIRPGTVKITVKSKKNSKVKKTFKVTVKENAVKSVKITANKKTVKSKTLAPGETVTLKAKASPSDAAQSFEWKSNNPGVAKVSSKGKVTAVKTGTAKITATATDGSKKKKTVTINVTGGTATAEPTATPVPSHDFSADGAEYSYSADTGKVTMKSSSASGHVEVGTSVKDSVTGKNTAVNVIGKDALAANNVNSVVIPKGIEKVEDQKFTGTVNYVKVEDAGTAIGKLERVTYVIAPASSKAAAEAGGAEFVDISSVVEKDGFIYQMNGDAATLLCAVDSSKVSGNVVVPETVNGKTVTAVGEHALDGCGGATLTVPENVVVPDKYQEQTTVVVKIESVTIDENGLPDKDELFYDSVGENDAITLSYTVHPADASEPKIEWSCSGDDIFTFTNVEGEDKVQIVPKGAGTAKIVVTASNEYSKVTAETKEITVYNVLKGIDVTGFPTDLDKDEVVQLADNVKLIPESGTKERTTDIKWTKDGIEITGDIFTSGEVGTVTLTASIGEFSESVGIKVYPVPDGIKIDSASTYELDALKSFGVESDDEGFTLTAGITPAEGLQEKNKKVTWSSSDASVAEVDENGKVTIKGAGDVVITAETTNRKTDTLAFHVYAAPEITITCEKTTLYVYGDGKIESTSLQASLPEGVREGYKINWEIRGEDKDNFSITVDEEDGRTATVLPNAISSTTDGITIVASVASPEDNPRYFATVDIKVEEKQYRLNSEDNGKLDYYNIIENGKVTIPETLDGVTITSLKDALISGNANIKGLTELEIQAQITEIPASLCEGCSELTTVTLPNSVKVIKSGAFKNAGKLSSLTSK